MAKLKVLSVELIAPITQKEQILEYLQKKGTVEVSAVTGDYTSLQDRSQDRAALDTDASSLQSALHALDAAVPVKKPLTAMLEPRIALSEEAFAEKAAAIPETVALAENVLALQREAAELEEEIARLRAENDTLEPWADADFPVRSGSTGRVSYLLGSVRKAVTREELEGVLSAAFPEIDCVEFEIYHTFEDQTTIAAFCMDPDAAEVEQALREYGFVFAPDCASSSPGEKIRENDSQIAADETRLREIGQKLTETAEKRGDLQFALDALAARRELLGAAEKTGQTERVFLLRGYAAEKDAERVKKQAEAKFDAAVELREPAEDEDVPVILKNNGFASPLENITGMYSLPGRADIDPTGSMAFFYYLFFGMMLSDAGYGLLIVLLTGGALLFKRDMERRMRNNVKMYFFCGLSTVFWGAMYGSWFGDAPQVIMREFFHKEIGPLYIWTDAVTDTMNVLIMCFILGLVHLFWGVLMKGWTDIKNGHKLDALFDTIPTFLTVIGIAPIFFGLFAQDSIPAGYTPLGTFFFNVFTAVHNGLKPVSTYLLIAGLVLVIATAGRHSKSIGGKLGGGLYAVYGMFSGYLGDVLSYARLLALGMATGVIGQVMNMLGTLPGNPVVKVIMFIPVFIAGHAANLAINLIGAYVHTNRLQYVEFFSKFYEGGGRAFAPLEANTKFYRIKEEN